MSFLQARKLISLNIYPLLIFLFFLQHMRVLELLSLKLNALGYRVLFQKMLLFQNVIWGVIC